MAARDSSGSDESDEQGLETGLDLLESSGDQRRLPQKMRPERKCLKLLERMMCAAVRRARVR